MFRFLKQERSLYKLSSSSQCRSVSDAILKTEVESGAPDICEPEFCSGLLSFSA